MLAQEELLRDRPIYYYDEQVKRAPALVAGSRTCFGYAKSLEFSLI